MSYKGYKKEYPADKRIHVRCQEAQFDEIHRRAAAAGLTFSEYVLSCCLKGWNPNKRSKQNGI